MPRGARHPDASARRAARARSSSSRYRHVRPVERAISALRRRMRRQLRPPLQPRRSSAMCASDVADADERARWCRMVDRPSTDPLSARCGHPHDASTRDSTRRGRRLPAAERSQHPFTGVSSRRTSTARLDRRRLPSIRAAARARGRTAVQLTRPPSAALGAPMPGVPARSPTSAAPESSPVRPAMRSRQVVVGHRVVGSASTMRRLRPRAARRRTGERHPDAASPPCSRARGRSRRSATFARHGRARTAQPARRPLATIAGARSRASRARRPDAAALRSVPMGAGAHPDRARPSRAETLAPTAGIVDTPALPEPGRSEPAITVAGGSAHAASRPRVSRPPDRDRVRGRRSS